MRTLQQLPSPLRRLATSAIGTYAAYLAHGLRHPRLLRSSATDRERAERLPGDELVGELDWVTDFATTIDAEPAQIWPWLEQMGYGRAGWYGWYPYENGGRGSAEQLATPHAALAVGDLIPDGPRASDGYGIWRVEQLARERSLVLHSRRQLFTGLEVEAGARAMHVDCSWAFVLTPMGAQRTRLHARVRARVRGGRGGRVLARAARVVFGLGDAVMENTMLAGIRRRAERRATVAAS